jgi:hypothetical protein
VPWREAAVDDSGTQVLDGTVVEAVDIEVSIIAPGGFVAPDRVSLDAAAGAHHRLFMARFASKEWSPASASDREYICFIQQPVFLKGVPQDLRGPQALTSHTELEF